jgi:hypothetical protein
MPIFLAAGPKARLYSRSVMRPPFPFPGNNRVAGSGSRTFPISAHMKRGTGTKRGRPALVGPSIRPLPRTKVTEFFTVMVWSSSSRPLDAD